MKVNKNVFIAFLAFVIGQLIQIIANAVAVSMYAYRPVLWCAFVGFATIVLVLLTMVVSGMESNQGGSHEEKKPTQQELVEKYAEPPKTEKKRTPIYFGVVPDEILPKEDPKIQTAPVPDIQ